MGRVTGLPCIEGEVDVLTFPTLAFQRPLLGVCIVNTHVCFLISKRVGLMSGKMLASNKCVDCILWQERQRQWLRERESLLAEIELLRSRECSSHQPLFGRLSPTPSTIAGSPQGHALGTPDPIGTSTGSALGRTASARRISRTGSLRTLVRDVETMTDPEREKTPPPPPTPSPSPPRHVIVKSALEELYESQKKEIERLNNDVSRLQSIILRQEIDARDSINANQRQFLRNHKAQLEEEQRLRGLQRSLLLKGAFETTSTSPPPSAGGGVKRDPATSLSARW